MNRKIAIDLELAELARQNDGVLRPSEVVRFAQRKKQSALHGEFEWDDTVAAHEYRLEQARSLIRTRVVMVRPDKPPMRVYCSLASDRRDDVDGAPKSYRRTEDVLRDPLLRLQLLQQAQSELYAWRKRYQDLTELAAIFSTIDGKGGGRGTGTGS